MMILPEFAVKPQLNQYHPPVYGKYYESLWRQLKKSVSMRRERGEGIRPTPLPKRIIRFAKSRSYIFEVSYKYECIVQDRTFYKAKLFLRKNSKGAFDFWLRPIPKTYICTYIFIFRKF